MAKPPLIVLCLQWLILRKAKIQIVVIILAIAYVEFLLLGKFANNEYMDMSSFNSTTNGEINQLTLDTTFEGMQAKYAGHLLKVHVTGKQNIQLQYTCK